MITRLKSYLLGGDPLVRAGQFAQVLRQLVLIFIALLLPRLAVTRSDIGYWEQMQYLGYLMGFAWLNGLGQAYLARIRQLAPDKARLLTRLVLLLTLFLTLFVASILWCFESPVLELLQVETPLPGWSFYLVFLLSHWPGLMYEQVLLAHKQAQRLWWFSIVSNGALAAAIILPLALGYSWAATLPCLIGVSLIKAAYMLLPTKELWSKQQAHWLNSSVVLKLQDLLRDAAPLVTYAALGGVIVSFDPWFVNYWYDGDPDQFALYRYGTRELPLIVAITNGIGQALLPKLNEDRTTGLLQLKASSLRLMHLFFPAAILLLLTSPWWWTPIFTAEFSDSVLLFQIFIFVGISRLIFPIVILTATGHGKALIGLGILELVLNVLLSWWLVQDFGLAGIVWATVIAYTLDKLLAAAYLYYTEGISLRNYCALPYLLMYSLFLLGSFLLLQLLTS